MGLSNTVRSALTLIGLGIAVGAHATPTTPLQDGVAQNFSIGGHGLVTTYYIDVPAAAQQLKIELRASNTAQDVDLLLRYGSPFPDTVEGGPPTDTYLKEFSQYRSESIGGSERLDISRASTHPVAAGRWYIAALNFDAAAAGATLTATTSNVAPGNLPISVVFDDTSGGCDVSGWNDSTPKSAVGGNSGTTLGQQRRNAINEAARLLGQSYKSAVPVAIQACWANLGTGNSITLAQARGQFVLSDEKWLPRNHTWYVNTPVSKLSGATLCRFSADSCPQNDMLATFNNQVDTPAALGSASFYYGLQSNPNNFSNDVDFISVAMHELTHGLGFASQLTDNPADGVLGSKLSGTDDIYSANLVDVHSDGRVVPFMSETDAERAAALTANNQLRFNGAEIVTSFENVLASATPPDNFVQVYTPNPLQPGSTLSHLGITSGQQLMLPTATGTIRTPGLSQPILHALGWSPEEKALVQPLLTKNMQMYDAKHGGHGIDFARVTGNTYFLIFYTYDSAGEPEWYIAIGPMVDGVFMPGRNASGSSLVRYKYVAGGSPPQQADPSIQGDVRLDFNGARNSPACNDGRALSEDDPTAVMTWSLGSNRDISWCMQSLFPQSIRSTPDYAGTWYSGTSDSGWGFSFGSYQPAAPTKGFFGLVYFPDANGFGRWAYVQTDNYLNGTTYNLKQRRGYCRTCAMPAGFTDIDSGTIKLTINSATQENVAAGNKVSFDVDFKDAPFGHFKREDSSLTLLSVPAGQ